MTKDQEDAIYGAYLGICALKTMVRKVGLSLAMGRCDSLLVELCEAFPFINERVARSVLRQEHQS